MKEGQQTVGGVNITGNGSVQVITDEEHGAGGNHHSTDKVDLKNEKPSANLANKKDGGDDHTQ